MLSWIPDPPRAYILICKMNTPHSVVERLRWASRVNASSRHCINLPVGREFLFITGPWSRWRSFKVNTASYVALGNMRLQVYTWIWNKFRRLQYLKTTLPWLVHSEFSGLLSKGAADLHRINWALGPWKPELWPMLSHSPSCVTSGQPPHYWPKFSYWSKSLTWGWCCGTG